MNEIELSDNQIIDLIFERKIDIGDSKILTTNSFHEILAKLEERLCYGKIDRSETATFRGNDNSRNTTQRVPTAYRTVGLGRKAVYDFV